jgi:predicted dehydrogenase
MMKTIVIGAGYWGKNYVRELAGNCVGVVEQDADRAEYISKTYNVKVYPDLDSIGSVEYDAAVVATPPQTHIELALPIARAGKYLLIEKPMAAGVEEAMMLRRFKERIMVGHIYLHHPSIHALKAKVSEIPIDHAYSRRTNHGPIRDWQDAMWDLASHDISIFNFIFGESPQGLDVIGAQDWCMLRLSYYALNALIYVSWLGGPKIRQVELVPIEGENRIIFDDLTTVLEISPLRRMLDMFQSGTWSSELGYEGGLEVVNVLEKASRS